MKVKISVLSCIAALLLFTQCSKDFDTYYDRPAWLEDPIYEELEAAGNFTKYLEAVDRTLYADVLKGASLYTCFAPNDSAFNVWLAAKNYGTVADIPQDEVEDLVAYSLVYSQFESENLGASLVNKVWTPGTAYKYKTPYYPMILQEEKDGENVYVIDGNYSGGYSIYTKTYLVQNYKYLPVYTKDYFNASSPALTAEDYELLYPGSKWCATDTSSTGEGPLANVGPATIVGAQHLAENGVFYELNKVVDLNPSMYYALKSDTLHQGFFDLMNYQLPNNGTLYFKFFTEIDQVTEQYKQLYPDLSFDDLWIRGYSMPVDPVAEAWSGDGLSSDISQENGGTIFVPSDAAIEEFKNTRLLRYYNSLEEVPYSGLFAFMYAQMTKTLVWPSYLNSKTNSLGEYLTGATGTNLTTAEMGITDMKMTSNGILYYTDKPIKSRWFETIYYQVFMNPKYNLLSTAFDLYYSGSSGLQEELMKCTLTGYENERNTIFLLSDDLLKADGFSYDEVNTIFNHSVLSQTDAAARLKRLMKNSVFLGYRDTIAGTIYEGANLTPEVLASTSTSKVNKGLLNYNYWQYRTTNNGELIRFKENKIQAVCDVEYGTNATVTHVETTSNGNVFTLDQLPKFTPVDTQVGDSAYIDRSLWYYLQQAKAENPNDSIFVNLVEQVMLTTSGELLGIKSSNFYTVLIPENASMIKARNAGLFPKNILPESDADGTDKALRFLQSHFIQGQIFPDDNLPIIYPFTPLADDPSETFSPTILAINSDDLGLTNERTQVGVKKFAITSSSNYLYFYAKDIKRGATVLVRGTPKPETGISRPYRNCLQVLRTQIAGASDYTKTQSNRMACKAVIHTVNNYLNFEDVPQ
jgi:uncharacterized surface protein with fasciclin (FAS1) repeats